MQCDTASNKKQKSLDDQINFTNLFDVVWMIDNIHRLCWIVHFILQCTWWMDGTRPVARGCDALPKSSNRSTFSHKICQKWGFCRRVKGVWFKKSTFWVQKVQSTFGVLHPHIDPGYKPGCDQQYTFSECNFLFIRLKKNSLSQSCRAHLFPSAHLVHQNSSFQFCFHFFRQNIH